MNRLSIRLKSTIDVYHSKLKNIDHRGVGKKPKPDKWSKKEILGHLIDSAANNHQRFLKIRSQEELVFDGYDQIQWVEYQGYQNKDWEHIVDFWVLYNLHLSGVIGNISDEVLNKKRPIHNLDQIAFRIVPASEPTTLNYFIGDYIDHLEHHLRQIIG